MTEFGFSLEDLDQKKRRELLKVIVETYGIEGVSKFFFLKEDDVRAYLKGKKPIDDRLASELLRFAASDGFVREKAKNALAKKRFFVPALKVIAGFVMIVLLLAFVVLAIRLSLWLFPELRYSGLESKLMGIGKSDYSAQYAQEAMRLSEIYQRTAQSMMRASDSWIFRKIGLSGYLKAKAREYMDKSVYWRKKAIEIQEYLEEQQRIYREAVEKTGIK